MSVFVNIYTPLSPIHWLFVLWMIMCAGGLTGCDSHPGGSSDPKKVVFLISEDPDNYEADQTIPLFARQLEEKFNFKSRVLLSKGARESSEFPGLEETLDSADLLVVFCRRLALPESQMKRIKQYISDRKPVLGIRTANHAFSVLKERIPVGFTDWPGFVPEVMGCENRGYGPVGPGTEIAIVSEHTQHPIMQGIDKSYWHTIGNVYKVAPLLDQSAEVLMTGLVREEGIHEPVAWTRENGNGGNVFYTSLGHPADFENKDFIKILNQAVAWLIQKNVKPSYQ